MDIFTPTTMILQSLVYLTTWLLTSLYINHHGPSTTIAPIFTKYHNRIYSLFSLLLCLFILFISFQSSYQDGLNSDGLDLDRLARNTFHLSKFYEYTDILSVTALHTHHAIDLHFAFHHLTTPWLTFIRVLPDGEACEGWRWFAAANTAHHALMYAYFGGVAGERTAKLGRVLRWTGEGQLVLGMVVDA
ncbi:hypothetical protein B0J18DRAFT_432915, partial [Chaetomium sp. MPI-SDFR-AT-0129]